MSVLLEQEETFDGVGGWVYSYVEIFYRYVNNSRAFVIKWII